MVRSVEHGGESGSIGLDGLTPQQNQALLLLGNGMAISEVAQRLGVHRTTVYRWVRFDPKFRAAYHAWEAEQRESCRAALLQCAQRATQKIKQCIDIDYRLAKWLVQSLGMVAPARALPIEPDQVERLIDIEEREANAELERRWEEQDRADGPDNETLLAALRRYTGSTPPIGPSATFNSDQTRATPVHEQESDSNIASEE